MRDSTIEIRPNAVYTLAEVCQLLEPVERNPRALAMRPLHGQHAGEEDMRRRVLAPPAAHRGAGAHDLQMRNTPWAPNVAEVDAERRPGLEPGVPGTDRAWPTAEGGATGARANRTVVLRSDRRMR